MKTMLKFLAFVSITALFLVALPVMAADATSAAAVSAAASTSWLQVIVAILNTNAFITLVGAFAAFIVAKVFTAKPAWAQYEGMIITAIKTAEKIAIPEGTTNTGLVKARVAIDTFIQQYTTANGKVPTEAVIDLVKAAIPIVHDKLDANGTL